MVVVCAFGVLLGANSKMCRRLKEGMLYLHTGWCAARVVGNDTTIKTHVVIPARSANECDSGNIFQAKTLQFHRLYYILLTLLNRHGTID